MANAQAGNVIICDTDGSAFLVGYRLCIESVKLIATGAATLTIKKTNTSGATLYAAALTAAGEKLDQDIDIESPNGIYVNISGTGAKAYLYLK